jgi:hypothetical protein
MRRLMIVLAMLGALLATIGSSARVASPVQFEKAGWSSVAPAGSAIYVRSAPLLPYYISGQFGPVYRGL